MTVLRVQRVYDDTTKKKLEQPYQLPQFPVQQFPLSYQYMTRGQVAELCHVQELTVYLWEKKGRLRSYRPGGTTKGGRVLYKYEDVMALIEGGK